MVRADLCANHGSTNAEVNAFGRHASCSDATAGGGRVWAPRRTAKP